MKIFGLELLKDILINDLIKILNFIIGNDSSFLNEIKFKIKVFENLVN